MKTKLTVVAGVLLGVALAQPARAADPVTIQLKWVTQAQFAGYYVAKAKGFYKDAGLDVTIKPGGPDLAPPQVIAGGGADVIVDWMPSALASREKGVPLVNIAQPFKKSGLELTCRADTGITKPTDLKSKTIGVWFFGNEYPFLSWMSKLGFKTDGSPGGVKMIKQGFNVDPLLQKQAECISTMTYNEYWQVIDAGYKPSQLVVFKYEDQGVATMEDGLYALESKLAVDHSLPGKGVGVQSTEEWAPEAQAMLQYKIVPKLPPVADMQNNAIVAGLYSGTKLNWPG